MVSTLAFACGLRLGRQSPEGRTRRAERWRVAPGPCHLAAAAEADPGGDSQTAQGRIGWTAARQGGRAADPPASRGGKRRPPRVRVGRAGKAGQVRNTAVSILESPFHLLGLGYGQLVKFLPGEAARIHFAQQRVRNARWWKNEGLRDGGQQPALP